ncbi:MAG: porin family protein [Saprospiraceae bacterium]
MMKRILIFSIFTAIALPVHSQNFKYGISIGSNYSTLVVEDFGDTESSSKLGYQFSLVAAYKIDDELELKMEPGFVNRGTVISSFGQAEQKVDLNYFALPLLANYSPIKKFSLIIGLEYAYKVSSKFEKKDSSFIKYLVDRKYDVGLIAGVSVRPYNKFEIGLRFNRGLLSTSRSLIESRDIDGNILKSKFINQGFSVGLTYMIKEKVK